MARLAPTGMIFIPCENGISHNEIEDAKPDHITAGANVLLHAMLDSSGSLIRPRRGLSRPVPIRRGVFRGNPSAYGSHRSMRAAMHLVRST